MKKKISLRSINIYIYILCILLISLFFALERIYISHFEPINGDFQNYNPMRRILDGQVPYRDFANYLGMGVLLINLPFLLLSNSFAASLFITNFTACLTYCLIITIILYVSTGRRNIAFLGGAGFVLLPTVLHRLEIYGALGFTKAFYKLTEPGNSMRVERAFLPFLLIGILLLVFKLRKNNIFDLLKKRRTFMIFGAVVGLMIPWSNDFGFASFASAFLVLAVLSVYINKKAWKTTLLNLSIFVAAAFAGLFICIFIITLGNPMAFFKFTAGVADYQFWYFGSVKKLLSLTALSLYNKPCFWFYISLFLILMVYFVIKLCRKKLTQADALICYANLTAFFASAIYAYGCGGLMYEALSLTVLFSVVGLIIRTLAERPWKRKLPKAGNGIISVLLCCILLFSVYQLYGPIKNLGTDRGVPYVEELKGYNEFAGSLEKAKTMIGDEQIFSTYASALEVMTGQYQPTGIDYIIHVLGDEQRERYVDTFLAGDYTYALTIRPEYTWFEGWVKRANWFWYKELYAHYVPVSTTDYNTIWQKTETPRTISADIGVDIQKINDRTYDIVLTSDNKENFIVDIALHYKSSYVFNLYRLQTFKKVVSIRDESMNLDYSIWDNYLIPESSNEYPVPVIMNEGMGKITITSLPDECTALEVFDVKVNGVLPNYFYRVEVTP